MVKVCTLIMNESQRNIIVVDDNLEQRVEVAGALENSHSVEILDSAQKLLPHLKSSDVNLLVVSADLLESYCLSVVLDVIERWPGLPIVIVSGRTEQSERVTDLYTNLSSAVVQLPLEANRLQDAIGTAMKEKPFSTLDTP
jgi:DNA-binding NtrC family response regulator